MKRRDRDTTTTRPRFGTGFWIGLGVLVLVSLLGLIDGVGGSVGFASAFLALTLLWHFVVGKSWLSALFPLRRKQALIGIPISVVLMAVGMASAPASETTLDVPTTTQTSSRASSPQNSTSVTGSTQTPSQSSSSGPSESGSLSPTSSDSPTPIPSATPTPTAAPTTVTGQSTALEVLATVPIKGRAPRTNYDRDLFGQAWYDLDRNGCDTRNDMLRRDLVKVTLKDGTRDCVVLTGTLSDPYTATSIPFVRGQGTSTIVQIDHVVALGDAWQKGAQQLSIEKRVSLANDPLNLLAVYGPTNQSKGDGDAATWLPPNKSFRCAYVARQTVVKAKYGLWMTQAEHDAVARILAGCPNQPIPNATLRPLVTITASMAPKPTAPKPTVRVTTQAPKPAPTSTEPQADVYYKNCTAAREAGVAPIHAGQPGYRSGLDRDHDGVACE
ncbi:GmrSD restriction endonuclease domain-containing protein [Aestuariimicrobium kwangyangense]|uniref:GmrSD restriction endonuclease domain-containing protein n=1 Tax=Aestuariimicrobium kwangyangense TaxID=396389 RepID=UPI000A008AFB